jgi:hypothetical protein
MSHSNPNFGIAREVRFAEPQKLRKAAPGTANQLLIAGQGVLIFKLKRLVTPDFSTEITFSTAENTGLRLILSAQSIQLIRFDEQGTKLLFENREGITTNKNAFWWASLDAPNCFFRFGVGEARLETLIVQHQFPSSDSLTFLKKIERFGFDTAVVSPIRLLRDPVQESVPMIVKNMDELTMLDIASSAYMPKANLNPIGQQLYENVAGEKFVLNDASFPDFDKAIEHSIATPGCWCYETLKTKSEKQPAEHSKRIYLRITLGQNGGESPGIPYVMEIWPAGCYSSIHNHAGANALIRVLHGEIGVYLFAYLGAPAPYHQKPVVFKKNDITWISPTLNQFHQLINPNTAGPTCITIQCYMYDADDTGHYNYFNYIGNDDEIKDFNPNSDCDFLDFRTIIESEWKNRNN